MTTRRKFPLVAVDVGNSRVKLGLFESRAGGRKEAAATALPEPARTLTLAPDAPWGDELARWLAPRGIAEVAWWLGSVRRDVAARLVEALRERGAEPPVLLAAGDLPLTVSVPRPDMVGIDRLLAAVAANALRKPQRSIVIVSVGTAITVNLVSYEGNFLGGAILPGIGLSARALHEFTDLLPKLDLVELGEPPPALGTATIPALHAGLFWGAIGGIRQLVEMYAKRCLAAGELHRPDLVLTGGAAPSVAGLIGESVRYEPHLVLSGIALAAAASR